jgi:alpha,alpha-trehalose phosphorylase
MVDIGPEDTRYELLSGDPLDVLHYGRPVSLAPGAPQTRSCPLPPEAPAVQPPPGRGPYRRGEAPNGTSAGANQPRTYL